MSRWGFGAAASVESECTTVQVGIQRGPLTKGRLHNPLTHLVTVRYVDITDRCSRRGDRGVVVAFNTMRAQPSGRGLTLAAARCARG